MIRFLNEWIFVLGIVCSYSFLRLIEVFGVYSLWGSLIALVITAAFYSITFFKTTAPFEKLYFYLFMLPLLLGYFALIYKAFGIIDTSTNELIKPDWLNAIYFSVVTWTTLGYGDFKPGDDLKVWVIIEALMGYVYMGLLIGKILTVSARRANITTR